MTEDGNRLRTVLTRVINECPPGEREQLRQRIVQFAAGLEPADLEIFEQAVSELNEGPDVRVERELAGLLADFIAQRQEAP